MEYLLASNLYLELFHKCMLVNQSFCRCKILLVSARFNENTILSSIIEKKIMNFVKRLHYIISI